MVNNTVNGVKIGTAAGRDKKFEICSTAVQKGRREKGITVTNNQGIETLAMLFMPEGVIKETCAYIAIKAQDGGKPQKEGLVH